MFLVACTRLYTPLCRSVGRLVGWSVDWSVGNAFVFSAFFGQFSHHFSCPIARDWVCRAYGLVMLKNSLHQLFFEKLRKILCDQGRIHGKSNHVQSGRGRCKNRPENAEKANAKPTDQPSERKNPGSRVNIRPRVGQPKFFPNGKNRFSYAKYIITSQ